ncbi:MAG: hypothetical protein HOU81_05195 [Hamadaea sp.]|uniref:hypothetical protein n=1 Tax=Hamadaea sp. TaxID=2024425 RepID=UPI0017F93960|nr:hypothetical protein [Hamadaea sp.]NUR70193.1 hypothetical protein [Hamadaea sp.]NUT24140.1 hypothetical protein [Hamadaea sp.]
MSHEVTIGDLRASRWNVPDFDTVWRGLDPAQVGRFIRAIHADVAQAISGYETALAVAEEERLRLETEVLRLRGPVAPAIEPSMAEADVAEATVAEIPDVTAEVATEPESAEPSSAPSRRRRREAAPAAA